MIPSKSSSAGLVIFRRKYSLAEILNTLHEDSYMKQPLVYQHMAFFIGHANWTISHIFGTGFTFPSVEAGGKLLERRATFAGGNYLGT